MIGVDDNWGTRPEALNDALRQLQERVPAAKLTRNQVGNIAVMDTALDEQVGYIDYGSDYSEKCRLVLFEDADDDA